MKFQATIARAFSVQDPEWQDSILASGHEINPLAAPRGNFEEALADLEVSRQAPECGGGEFSIRVLTAEEYEVLKGTSEFFVERKRREKREYEERERQRRLNPPKPRRERDYEPRKRGYDDDA